MLATQPNKLNDPFEFTPIFDDRPTDDEIREKLLHPGFYQEWRKQTGNQIPFEIYKQQIRDNIELLIAEQRRLEPEVTESYRQDFMETTGKASGLTCFSRRNDGLLLWSHYADGHKGFVVGFGVPQIVNSFGRDEAVLVGVLYKKARPKISLYANVEEPNIVRRIVGTKSPEWKYEEEYRLIIPRENFHDYDGEEKDGRLFWSIKANEQVVQSVIIGSRCDPKLKESLAAVLAEPAYQHVETFEAIPDKMSFSIHIKPVTLC
jgi:hypothetical protein